MSYRPKRGVGDFTIPEKDFTIPEKTDLVTWGMVGVAVLIALSAFRTIFGGRR
jgi:hypothetical protein